VLEAADGAIGGAGIAGDVVFEFAEGHGGPGGMVVGEGGAGGVVELLVGFLQIRSHGVHAVIDEGGNEGPRAAETPFGNRIFLDNSHFGVILRSEAGNVGVQELFELLRGLVAEEDVAGLEPVGDGVAGSYGLPFGSEGTARECAIAAGSFDLFVGTHGISPRVENAWQRGIEERAQRPCLMRFLQRGVKERIDHFLQIEENKPNINFD